MIDDLLNVLKKRVNDHLRMSAGWRPADAQEEWVVFPSSDRLDLADFKLKAVTLLLINLEEEHALRTADPYRRTLADGSTLPGQPPILMNAYVLFVARFAAYEESARCISRIAQLFQERRVLDHDNTPELSTRIEKLVLELVTLPFSEQNHLWGMLRTAYQPSLLYRVRMLVFQDAEVAAVRPVTRTDTTASRLET